MQAKDLNKGMNLVCLTQGGNKYIRINAHSRVIPRPKGTTVFANVLTGRIRFVKKDAPVFPAK